MQTGWVQGVDPWLWAEEKSDMSQEEVGAEFIEDSRQTKNFWERKGEKRVSLNFAWGLKFY